MRILPELCGCFWGCRNSAPLPPNPRGPVTCKRGSIDSLYTSFNVKESYMPFYVFTGSGLAHRLW